MRKLSKKTQDMIIEKDFFGTHERTWEEKTEEERIYEVEFGIRHNAREKFFTKNMDLLYKILFENEEPDDLHLNSVHSFISNEFRDVLETIELTEHDIKCMISAVKPEMFREEIIG